MSRAEGENGDRSSQGTSNVSRARGETARGMALVPKVKGWAGGALVFNVLTLEAYHALQPLSSPKITEIASQNVALEKRPFVPRKTLSFSYNSQLQIYNVLSASMNISNSPSSTLST